MARNVIKKKSTIRTYISLFSSAGVGCYGFKLNNFECIATNELLEDRLNVQRYNHKCKREEGYICGDINSEYVQHRLYDEINWWKINENIKQVDVVFATPPCQGMSTANYKKKDEKPRNSLVVEAIKLIMDIHPKVFVFENVRAFIKTTCKDISNEDMTIGESIKRNLSSEYNIEYKIINFKDYGVPSSRPRTIVIGTCKELHNISPLNLFPIRQEEKTLRQVIGDLPSLKYGEHDPNDLYHFFREYPRHMEAWISELAEGQSAFENTDPERRPYQLDKEGNRIINKGAYMGNKYRRLYWDKPCSCITTRNDQLASQDTIHPCDNRVLSIRELMRLMTIPDIFQWAPINAKDVTDYKAFLKKYELNIRRCIGEAVPTEIIYQIAKNINTLLDYEDFVEAYEDSDLSVHLANIELRNNFYIDTFLKEQQIEDANKTGSFYTSQFVVYEALNSISIDKPIIRILEPAVGLGAFIPQLSTLFSNADRVIIDCVEIDGATIASLRDSLKNITLGCNVEINYYESDFLTFNTQHHYDLVATNPPYGKTLTKYPSITGTDHKTKNLFALFLLKLFDVADELVCIIPKNFAIADEFYSVRRMYQNYPIVRVCDFGVKFFKKVFVEIVSIHFSNVYTGNTEVVDYINDRVYHHPQGYMFHRKLWLLYRNEWFDEYIRTLTLDVFDFYRDRAITKSKVHDSGRIRVIRSKNIEDDGSVVSIPGYDKYIDDESTFAVGRFLNSRSIIMPNFTYNTRATILPDNSIPNGSIAILLPKRPLGKIDLGLYATPDFRKYYAIVKSYSKFTLNIDDCSIYYIGIKNGKV